MVGRAAPFHITTELASNPVPVMLIVAEPPGGTYRGEIALIAGAGLFTVNDAWVDVPPPGAGFSTVIALDELPAISAAGTTAVNCVALTNVVLSDVPFHSAVELEMNPDPVIVTVVFADPAVELVGEIAVMAGVGFDCGAGLGGAVVPPPPQPPRKCTVNKTHPGRALDRRFMAGFPSEQANSRFYGPRRRRAS